MKNIKIKARNLNFYYGKKQALSDISIDIPEKNVTAFIGPSGCGKSTFLRLLNSERILKKPPVVTVTASAAKITKLAKKR